MPSESHVNCVWYLPICEAYHSLLRSFRLNIFDCYTQDELIQGSSHGNSPSADDPPHEPINSVMKTHVLGH